MFIEELTTSVAEGRVEGALPTSMKTLIASRIDALPPDERRVMIDASVLGKVFWHGALERMGGDASASLESLEGRDLIRRETVSRIGGDTEYTFKHVLLREAAYATLPRPARREKHALAAAFLEQATGERTSESATMLAHHWREAGDTDRAWGYLLTAAENASRAWAKAEAVKLYQDAVGIRSEGDERVIPLRVKPAVLLVEAGDLASAAAALDGLLPQLEGRLRL